MHPEPGRVPGEQSFAASRQKDPRSEEGYEFTGYDSPAATRIGDETADNPKFDRLRQHHEGRHQSDGGYSTRESRSFKKRTAQAICSQLPVTSREKERVVTAVLTTDLDVFGNQKNINRVTLGFVAVLVDERIRDPDSIDDLVERSSEFQEIREKHDVSMSDFSTVKQSVREVLDKEHLKESREVRNRDPALPDPTAPEELPAEYWEAISADGWAHIAEHWEIKDSELKAAIPDDYRETVELLRHWEPWNRQDEEDDNTERESQRGDENPEDNRESPGETAPPEEVIDEAVITEVIRGDESTDN